MAVFEFSTIWRFLQNLAIRYMESNSMLTSNSFVDVESSIIQKQMTKCITKDKILCLQHCSPWKICRRKRKQIENAIAHLQFVSVLKRDNTLEPVCLCDFASLFHQSPIIPKRWLHQPHKIKAETLPH